MTACGLRRGAALALAAALLLPGCGDDAAAPPVAYEQPSYGYLTKLRLNVAQVDVDDSWRPATGPGLPRHVESLAPTAPVTALRQMAQDRILAGGSSGRARFVIQDASILAGQDRLDGSLAVRLDITTSDGAPAGFAEARVVRSATLGDSTDGGRATAYALVKQMMDDMNVEFEYQVRRSLHDYLQSTDPVAAPAPVRSQDLPPPGSPQPPESPLPAAGQLSPNVSVPNAGPPPSSLAPAPPGLPPSGGPTPLNP